MSRTFLGCFELGIQRVNLLVDSDTSGGFFSSLPDSGGLPEIIIGTSSGNLKQILGVLIHESLEFALNHMNCRYIPAVDISNDTSGYSFYFTHGEFSEAVARAGEFVFAAFPAITKHLAPPEGREKSEGAN